MHLLGQTIRLGRCRDSPTGRRSRTLLWFDNRRHGTHHEAFVRQNTRCCLHSHHHRCHTIGFRPQGRRLQTQRGVRSNRWLDWRNHPYRCPCTRVDRCKKSSPIQPLQAMKRRIHLLRIRRDCHQTHRHPYLCIETERTGNRRPARLRTFDCRPSRLHRYQAIAWGCLGNRR